MNYPDQNFIKRVHARAKAAKVVTVAPAKVTFQPLIKQEGIHPDRPVIDSFVKQSANIIGILVGPNDEYTRICDGIYENMKLVSNKKLSGDKEAHRKNQAWFVLSLLLNLQAVISISVTLFQLDII